MKFGIIINRKWIDRSASDPYHKLYSYVSEMEELGYDLAWCGQHRFSDKTAFGGDTATEPSAPLAMLAPLMARTTRMKFATNIMLLPAHHPLEVAEEINTLQEMSGNRFILGAGIGYKPDEFENVGWNFKTRARRFEECLEVLRLALTGQPFSYSGNFFNYDDVMITPPPLPGTHTPLWVGAVSEPAMLRAARLGDGWEISFSEHMLELAEKVKRYRGLAAEHGRPATVALMRDVHVVPKREDIDPEFLSNVIKVWQSYDDLSATADRDELSKEVMFGGKQVTLEEFAPHRAVVGTPEDCCREMESIRDLVNPEYFFITPTGVPDPEQQMRELRLFAREVMPHFRD
ncbi:LLM class flavin-dependent oxidoreductase [Haliea sp. E17]|uniref:LLM class flavin-dependent oxidoreductase n=1 Tax=Haliea sp. E17 TaxID=3401576 RepID=UPI003AACF024